MLDRLAGRLPGTIHDTALYAALTRRGGWLTSQRRPWWCRHGGPRGAVLHAQAVADTVPGAELLSLAGADHVALFTHLDAIRGRAAAFLAAHL